MTRFHLAAALAIALVRGLAAGAVEPSIDLSKYSADSPVRIVAEDERLQIAWPLGGDAGEYGRLDLRLDRDTSPIEKLGVSDAADGPFEAIVAEADPAVFLTVGTRQMAPGQPPERQFEEFFDNPHQREHRAFASKLAIDGVRVASRGAQATVMIDGLSAGSFVGAWEFTFFAGSPLLRVEAVLSTEEVRRAYFYDAGLLVEAPLWSEYAWTDTEGRRQSAALDREAKDQPMAVRHRTLAIESAAGSLACFSPVHRFQFPRDYTNNLRFVWRGKGHLGLADRHGFGIRQNKDGGGAFVPWISAPPKSKQRMGVFYLLSGKKAGDALDEALRYTRNDHFADLDGFKTMTSHWHMAIAEAAMRRRGREKENPSTPDWVTMFREMNVNLVHLGEFHGDGHQDDPGPLRLPEMQAMFDECRRWSDDQLLVVPGEEVNKYLGLTLEGKHPGHWMSLFPKPVYWTMRRGENDPFVSDDPKYGKVYRVGSRADMIRLIKEENGLVWSAHPRIKASSWTPDIFRHEDFYLADYWLGAAWKAMPADLSRDKLGDRALDLLSDMANWGQKKYLLGEVDVFKIDHTHELYGHMNVNYVRLDAVPRFDDGWAPLLDALRTGQFFVTTGEVLIPNFTVGGKSSGENASHAGDPQLVADLQWTFPLAFAEIVSGDGEKVFRERLDLSDTRPFGERRITHRPILADRGAERRWIRFEVWDVCGNGAFTQPVWIVE